MPFSVFRKLRETAREWALSTPLYNWTLSGNAPDRLIVKPVDPWPGNAEHGRWICDEGYPSQHYHRFSWLRDLRAMGGDAARRQARNMMREWMAEHSRWECDVWRADVTGDRLSMWISHQEFFGDECYGECVDNEFQDNFYASLIMQARHLAQALPGQLYGLKALQAIKGLLYAGLALEGREIWVEHSLSLFQKELDEQILSDGGHVSRSPQNLLQALQITLDIRMALAAAGYPLPEKIQYAIDRMTPALRFFRQNDKHFTVFNGAQEGDESLIDCVLAQAGIRAKPLKSLSISGYERATVGRTTLFFDCGKVPNWPHDKAAHAAPLAFEMSYLKSRILVSCGAHPFDENWQEALRATAAHNTLTLENRNACEIKKERHFSRKVKNVSALREDSKDSVLLEASHDGYMASHGVTHRRRLYLFDDGHDLRGEDSLNCSVGLSRPLDYAIRFHIHPRVLVSLIQDDREALLRLPNGIGWRLHHSGGRLALEDSIYLGEGTRPRKTKQLVIYGQMTSDFEQIKWALQREGGA